MKRIQRGSNDGMQAYISHLKAIKHWRSTQPQASDKRDQLLYISFKRN